MSVDRGTLDVVPRRTLPSDLRAALVGVGRVERAAVTTAQRGAAARGTGRLLLACVEAGWRLTEVVPATGLKRSTGQNRLLQARREHIRTSGLDIALPGYTRSKRADLLAKPVDEREWITASEAAHLAVRGHEK